MPLAGYCAAGTESPQQIQSLWRHAIDYGFYDNLAKFDLFDKTALSQLSQSQSLGEVDSFLTTDKDSRLNTGVTIAAGITTVRAGDVLIASGAVSGRLINQGVVATRDADEVLYFTGPVSGRGSYEGQVVFAGGFSPGNSPAAVRLADAVLASSNTLTMELAGLTAGSEYDQLIIDGHLTLGGQLDVELLYGFTPKLGDTFQLFDGDFSGQFTDIIQPELDDGLEWDTSKLYTDGSLTVVPEPATIFMLATAGLTCLLRRGNSLRRA